MVLEELSGIASVAVFGVMTKRGAKRSAPPSCPSGRELLTEELESHVGNEISAYKVPKSWFFLETLH